MSGSTSRLGLSYEQGTDLASGFPARDQATQTILDDTAIYKQGTFVSRPSAGLKGLIYRATDDLSGGPNGTLYFDNGVSWEKVMLGADAEYAYSTFKPFGAEKSIQIAGSGSATAGRIYPLASNWQAAANDAANNYVGATGAGGCRYDSTFPMDASLIDAGPRTVKGLIIGNFFTPVATTAVFTVKLYRVTATANNTSGLPSISTVSAVSGGDWTVTGNGSAGQAGLLYSPAFTMPTTAGPYFLGVSYSGTIASLLQAMIVCRLDYQQV